MPSLPVVKAKGLNVSPNQLGVADGSMSIASNVIIRRDDVIESRRGMKHFGGSFGSISDRAKQIMEYRSRLIRYYGTTIQWDTEELNNANEIIFADFNGGYEEVQPGIRIKSVQAANNLYFTTNDGIKKLSSANATAINANSITNAGGVKALDVTAALDITLGSSTGFLPVDSTVAYRVVWGIRDPNNNLILGVPSQRFIIYNPELEMIVRDMMRVLGALDSLDQAGSFYNDGNYVEILKLDINASASQIRNNLIDLCEKLDLESGDLTTTAQIASAAISGGICTITFAAGYYQARQFQVGDEVYLSDFSATGGNLEQINGIQTVSAVTIGAAGTIQIRTTSTATAVVTSAASIQSGWFRSIEEPMEPVSPSTHDNAAALETYLSAIITELQSDRNVRRVMNNDGSTGVSPLEFEPTGSNSSGTTVTIANEAAGDARDFLANADLLFLNGLWLTQSTIPGDAAGLRTINAAPAAAHFQFTVAGISGGPDPLIVDDTSTVDRVLRFTNDLKNTYIEPLDITTSANVLVTFTIPKAITSNYFYQIYRSPILTAATTDVLSDLVPNDEMKLVYEDFPTTAQLAERVVTVEDIVPESFSQGAVNLYTNQYSGQGIDQANDRPPVALDMTNFNGYTFYGNTRTLNRDSLFLLGVQEIIADYDDGLVPGLTITDGVITNTYSFVKGTQQSVEITCDDNIVVTAAPGTYFTIDTANNLQQFYVWYKELDSATTDPAVADRIAIPVVLPSGFTATDVASYTRDAFLQLPDYFTASSVAADLVVQNIQEGAADIASAGTSTFTFVTDTGEGEKISPEITNLTIPAGSVFPNLGTSAYILLNTPFDRRLYYVWFQVGGSTNPALSGRTGLQVTILSGDTNTQVAQKLVDKLNTTSTITAIRNSNIVTTTTVDSGPTIDVTPLSATGTMSGVTGYSASVIKQGSMDVLLSNLVSPALAVDATTNSLVRIINRNDAEVVSAYYLSDAADTPGNILLESENLNDPKYYVLANQQRTGASFNPSLAPSVINNSGFNTATNPSIITANNHGMANGDKVVIAGSLGSVPNINGLYTISHVTTNTFTVPVNVITSTTSKGSIIPAVDANASDDEEKRNRVYYSKFQQPEAVPILNYIDVGAINKAILRIFPLRDSLFVFKEDGLFRLTGETAPFSVTLFNSSCILIASDSVDVANDNLYCWTTQGISAVSEGGVDSYVSRPIDNIILQINRSVFPLFPTATWGLGYESDNSYTVFTVQKTTDEYATIGFRFCTLTNTWTVIDKSYTCGIVKQIADNLYTGSGIDNYLEVERKNFNRTDYADHEYTSTLDTSPQGGPSFTVGTTVVYLGELENLKVGDVLQQEQTVPIYTYNMLLKKLDLDTGPAFNNYYSALHAEPGANMRSKLEALATKLDSDSNLSIIKTYSSGAVNTGTDTFTITNHGFENGNPVVFTGDIPTPLIVGDYYYIINSATNTFKVSATINGAAVDLTTTGSGSQTVQLLKYSEAILAREAFPISANSAGLPTEVTAADHQLLTGRYVRISNSSSVPLINNDYTVTRISNVLFSVPANVATPGTSGEFTTLIESFQDILGCYNIIVELLNGDSHISFSNYNIITHTTSEEAIITAIDAATNQIVLNLDLQFTVGPVTVFEAIDCSLVYCPQTMQDPLGLKHLREATLMFANKNFTTATLSFATDLLPEFIEVPFPGDGNGLFGQVVGFGNGFFGGIANSAPFRTYVPRQCQRCRYIVLKFDHSIAREKWAIFGYTLTGEVSQSSRAYR